jgi:hypothetical protein
MDRAIFPIENHKDDTGAVVDGSECDGCRTLFGTASGGERVLRVKCLGLHGRGSREQRSDNRQRQGKIVAHDLFSFSLARPAAFAATRAAFRTVPFRALMQINRARPS